LIVDFGSAEVAILSQEKRFSSFFHKIDSLLKEPIVPEAATNEEME